MVDVVKVKFDTVISSQAKTFRDHLKWLRNKHTKTLESHSIATAMEMRNVQTLDRCLLEEQKQDMERQHKEDMETLVAAYNQQIEDIKAENEEMRSECVTLRNAHSGMKLKLDTATNEVKKLKVEMEQQASTLKKIADERLEALNKTKMKLSVTTDELQTTKSKLRASEKTLSKMTTELADAKSEMGTLRKRNTLLENLNSTLKSELSKVQNLLAAAHTELNDANNRTEEQRKVYEELQNNYTTLCTQHDELKTLAQRLVTQVKTSDDELSRVGKKVGGLEKEKFRLEGELRVSNEKMSQVQLGLIKLMRQQQASQIMGKVKGYKKSQQAAPAPQVAPKLPDPEPPQTDAEPTKTEPEEVAVDVKVDEALPLARSPSKKRIKKQRRNIVVEEPKVEEELAAETAVAAIAFTAAPDPEVDIEEVVSSPPAEASINEAAPEMVPATANVGRVADDVKAVSAPAPASTVEVDEGGDLGDMFGVEKEEVGDSSATPREDDMGLQQQQKQPPSPVQPPFPVEVEATSLAVGDKKTTLPPSSEPVIIAGETTQPPPQSCTTEEQQILPVVEAGTTVMPADPRPQSPQRSKKEVEVPPSNTVGKSGSEIVAASSSSDRPKSEELQAQAQITAAMPSTEPSASKEPKAQQVQTTTAISPSLESPKLEEPSLSQTAAPAPAPRQKSKPKAEAKPGPPTRRPKTAEKKKKVEGRPKTAEKILSPQKEQKAQQNLTNTAAAKAALAIDRNKNTQAKKQQERPKTAEKRPKTADKSPRAEKAKVERPKTTEDGRRQLAQTAPPKNLFDDDDGDEASDLFKLPAKSTAANDGFAVTTPDPVVPKKGGPAMKTRSQTMVTKGVPPKPIAQDMNFSLPQGTEDDLEKLATQLEEDLRDHLERMLRAKLEAQIAKDIEMDLRSELEKELGSKYKRKMEKAMVLERKKVESSENVKVMNDLKGELEEALNHAEDQDKTVEKLKSTISAKEAASAELALLVREKDLLLTELTLLSRAYKEENRKLRLDVEEATKTIQANEVGV
jgi:hypothetical protein